MKKIIVAILLVFSISSTSYAAIPIMYWVGSGIINFTIAGVLWWRQSGASPTVNPEGTIKTPANVQWVDIVNGVPTIKNKEVSADIPINQARSMADANPGKYPKLNKALNGGVNLIEGNNPPDGSKRNNIYLNGQLVGLGPVLYDYTLNNGLGSGGPWVSSPNYSASTLNGKAGVRYLNGTSSTPMYKDTLYEKVPPYGTVPEIPPKFASNIATDGTSGTVNPLYQEEINKMLADPSYVPVFTDSTTGLPYAPPPSIPTQAQVDAAVAAQGSSGTLPPSGSTGGGSGGSGSGSGSGSGGSGSGSGSGSSPSPGTGTGTPGTVGAVPGAGGGLGGIGSAGSFSKQELKKLNFDSAKSLTGALNNTWGHYRKRII